MTLKFRKKIMLHFHLGKKQRLFSKFDIYLLMLLFFLQSTSMHERYARYHVPYLGKQNLTCGFLWKERKLEFDAKGNPNLTETLTNALVSVIFCMLIDYIE